MTMFLRPWPLAVLELAVVAGYVYLFDWVFHNPVCDLMFRCGCTWNWAGGWDACNVHNPPGDGPHCPWCEARKNSAWTTTWLVRGVAVASYYFLAFGLGRSRARRAAAVEASPLLGLRCDSSEAIEVQTAPMTRRGSSASGGGSDGSAVSRRGKEVAARLLLPPLAWFVACVLVGLAFFAANPDYPWFLFYTR